MDDFRNARINFNQYDFITPEEREKYLALPSTVEIRDREVDVDYDIDKRGGESIPVARLRLPKLTR